MLRFRWFALIFLLSFTLELSRAGCPENGCNDCFTWCPERTSLCNQTIIQRVCPGSCNMCPNAECNELDCSHRCIPPSNGNPARCECFEGYELDTNGKACNDINECDTDPNACSDGNYQVCVNTRGYFSCSNCTQADSEGIESYYGLRQGCCRINNATTCGKSSTNTSPRIVGGEDAEIGRWPWMAHLVLANATVLCGGSLITPDWIMTAAHCTEGLGPSDSVNILLGSVNRLDNYNTRAQVRNAAEIIQHPDFVTFPFTLLYDVALIRLDKPAVLNEFVNTICLPNGEAPSVGETCYAAGFGLLENEGNFSSRILQEVDVPIVSDSQCFDDLQDILTFPELHICTGYPEGGKSPCQGDSGGALMCQRCDSCDWYVAGIVSFGIGCALPQSPTVYVRVTGVEAWIAETIGFNFTSQECFRPYWGEWSQWSGCSVSCENGTRTRVRECMGGYPGDPDCFGPAEESLVCNTFPCIGWSPWTPYTGCSSLCGGGTQNRSRICLEGPGNCVPGYPFEIRDCNTFSCNCAAEQNQNSTGSITCCYFATSLKLCNDDVGRESMERICPQACCQDNQGQNCGYPKPSPDLSCRDSQADTCRLYSGYCNEEIIRRLCPSMCNSCPQ